MLKLYVRHGMVVDKVHKMNSTRQSKCLEKFITFITQKRNIAKIGSEKDFPKLLKNAFFEKTMKNIRNRIKVEYIRKDDNEKFMKQQSNLTFNGIHNTYTSHGSYSFKQFQVLIDKPIYLGCAVLVLSKLHI